MADHDRELGSSLPVSTDIVGTYTTEADNFKDDVSQRLTLDHYMDGVLTDGANNQDGRHRQVTMKELASDPLALDETGIVYTKDVDGVTELHYRDDSGDIVQITDNGELYKIDALKDFSELFDGISKITGTAGDGYNGYNKTEIDYPTDFTQANSIILSAKIKNTSSNWEQFGGFYYYFAYYGSAVILETLKISMLISSTYAFGDYEIIIGKIK